MSCSKETKFNKAQRDNIDLHRIDGRWWTCTRYWILRFFFGGGRGSYICCWIKAGQLSFQSDFLGKTLIILTCLLVVQLALPMFEDFWRPESYPQTGKGSANRTEIPEDQRKKSQWDWGHSSPTARWRFLAVEQSHTIWWAFDGHYFTLDLTSLFQSLEWALLEYGWMMEYLDEYSIFHISKCISEVTDTTIAAHTVTLPLWHTQIL